MKKKKSIIIIIISILVVIGIAIGLYFILNDKDKLTVSERNWVNQNIGTIQNINVINGIISDIIGDNKLEGIIINDKYIKLDGLFLLRNSIAPNSIVKDLILEDGYIVVNRNMETNIKGIYACGDCTGNPLQISKATGEGLVAAQNAAKYIDKLKEMI